MGGMDDNLDKIILLLTFGANEREVEAEVANFGLTPRKTRSLIARARERIILAAQGSREEEIGSAVRRCKYIIRKAAKDDPRTALAAQRELSKLLNLYTRYEAGGSDESAETVSACRRHLEPLNLALPSTPIEELCRLAVARIVALESRREIDRNEQNRLPEA